MNLRPVIELTAVFARTVGGHLSPDECAECLGRLGHTQIEQLLRHWKEGGEASLAYALDTHGVPWRCGPFIEDRTNKP